jgi:hypothetical protein
MPLLGQAALAMWWNMAPDMREEFEDWHTHEHFPERLAIPGFRRSSRWTSADGGEGIFVLYELDTYDVLSSPHYLARLNAPTPWSTKLMPHHRNMVRGQTRVLASRGAVIARHALTIRLAPLPARAGELRQAVETLVAKLPILPGLAGAHLLQHQAPDIPQTTEQKIRGGADRAVDWVLVVCGYDAKAMESLAAGELATSALEALGAAPGSERGLHALSCSGTPSDPPCPRES